MAEQTSVDKTLILNFLFNNFSGAEGFAQIWPLPENGGEFFSCKKELKEAGDYAAELAERTNVFFTPGIRGKRLKNGKRGGHDDVAGIIGYWADIDFLHPAHSEKNLPPSADAILEVIKELPFPFSLIVHTGHGIQAYCLFREPWMFDNEAERNRAAARLAGFQEFIRSFIEKRDWKMDNTADLARLMRLLGTVNRKDDPKPVTVLSGDGPRFNPDDFDEWIDCIEIERRKYPAPSKDRDADADRVLEGCAFMRHFRDDARDLPEPDWYAGLSVIGRCRDGENLAHDMSADYPGYTPEETEKKLKHALEAAGARRCRNLEQFGHCDGCPHRGRIKSPIVLGGGKAIKDPDDPIIYSANGVIKRTLSNAVAVLEREGFGDCLAHDAFREQITAIKTPPWDRNVIPDGYEPGPWTDHHDILTAHRLNILTGINFTPQEAFQAVEVIARKKIVHPVKDYLDGLEWDGKRRIDGLLSEYFGADDDEYSRLVGEKFLISAVARVYKPGCKVDHVLILEGEQGTLKSTALQVLFGEKWHGDTPFELGSKDSFLAIRGIWLYELAELDSFNRADSSRIKAFISSPTDRYRPPYGKRMLDIPRQCVFAGTTNRTEYLKDETGGRRFWPVRCGDIEIEAIRRDHDQIWAEAVRLFRDGAKWWPETDRERELCEEQQDERYQDDPWTRAIIKHLGEHAPKTITTDKLIEDAVNMDRGTLNKGHQTRIGMIMKRLGWPRKKISEGGERFYAYINPNQEKAS